LGHSFYRIVDRGIDDLVDQRQRNFATALVGNVSEFRAGALLDRKRDDLVFLLAAGSAHFHEFIGRSRLGGGDVLARGQGRWPSASACDLKYLSGWLTLVLPKRGNRFAEEKTREHAGHVVAIAPFVPDRSDAHNR
jgi:hypothetical protein